MYALFKETSHANFISHKSNYGVNPAANSKNWVAFDGQHVHYSTNNLDVLTQELVWYFRKTAGELNESIFNDRATITAIKGNSVAWNQLAPNSFSTGVARNVTFEIISNCTLYIHGTADTSYPQVNTSGNVSIIGGHKYCYRVLIRGTAPNPFGTHINSGSKSAWLRANQIATADSTASGNPLFVIFALGDNVEVNCCVTFSLFDLTQIYGAGNEPSTIDQFKNDYFKWFGRPIGIEPFDSGSIRNTKINALRTVGFNQYDIISDVNSRGLNGYNNTATLLGDELTFHPVGEDPTWGPTLFAGNSEANYNYKIKVIPNQAYRLVITNAAYNKDYYMFMDSSNRSLYFGSTSGKVTFTTSIDTCYLCIRIGNQNPNQVNNQSTKICLNISDDKLNGTYESYEDRTYSIPITSITGKLNGTGNSVVVFPEGMKSAGSVADEIVVEGGVTKAIKRIGVLNLGSLNWSKDNYTTLWRFIATHDLVSSVCLCDRYVNADYYGTNGTGIFANYSYNQIVIYDMSYSNSTTLKQSLQGVLFYYELATPQVYVLDNFNMPINIKCWKSGTERYESSDSTGTSPKLTIHYNAQ